jgi:hypothetical protein
MRTEWMTTIVPSAIFKKGQNRDKRSEKISTEWNACCYVPVHTKISK